MHLFLSPHLDDAVLSCGGTIHQLTQAGEPVLVVTVMAGDPPADPPDTPIVRDLHQRWEAGHNPAQTRRIEDEAALARLGAQARHLTVGDCVYRTAADGRPLYPSEESLFGDVDLEDPALDQLKALTLPDFTAVYAPMGVGHHVDHQIVRDWGLWLAGQHAGVSFKLFEEYPYTQEALAGETARGFYAGRTLRRAPQHLTEPDVAAKIAAIACYRSQISTFWPGLDDMAAATRGAMMTDDGPIEHYWIITEEREEDRAERHDD
jgi:LmbE family N-acetylglucosaminyl deacetylase